MSSTHQSTSTSIDNSVNKSSQPDDDSITVRRNSTVPTAANTKKPGSSMSSKGSKRKADEEIPNTTSSEIMAPRRSRRGDTAAELFQLEFDDEDNDDKPMMAAQSRLESRSQDEAGMTQNEVDVSKESVTSHTERGSGSIKKKRGRPPLSEKAKKERERDRRTRDLFIRK
ncbi:uncharacterized protein L199_003296 [Kwoniella botswanensis]|uniref:uncharacterized protein n=1 Tax=Kwoniella botswanensis TaxID=1268659 RepID=UPI00315DA6DF